MIYVTFKLVDLIASVRPLGTLFLPITSWVEPEGKTSSFWVPELNEAILQNLPPLSHLDFTNCKQWFYRMSEENVSTANYFDV